MPTESFDPTADLPFERRVAQPDMAALYLYWRRLARAGAPAFGDFDPIAMPRLLPDLQITRRDADGRHRIGLTGGRVAALAGRDSTGLYLDERIPPALYPSRAALYDEALDAARPIAYRSYLILDGREHHFQKRLLLPFVDAGPGPDLILAMALTASVPAEGAAAAAADGIVEILRGNPVG